MDNISVKIDGYNSIDCQCEAVLGMCFHEEKKASSIFAQGNFNVQIMIISIGRLVSELAKDFSEDQRLMFAMSIFKAITGAKKDGDKSSESDISKEINFDDLTEALRDALGKRGDQDADQD